MHTTFELKPEEWTESFWERIKPLFGKGKVRITVEDIEAAGPASQLEGYLRMKELQRQYPPRRVDESIDLSRLADESNETSF